MTGRVDQEQLVREPGISVGLWRTGIAGTWCRMHPVPGVHHRMIMRYGGSRRRPMLRVVMTKHSCLCGLIVQWARVDLNH